MNGRTRKGHPHPSGRLVRTIRVIGRPIWRVPDHGYVVPRLRDSEHRNAIGFTVSHLPGSWDEGETDALRRI